MNSEDKCGPFGPTPMYCEVNRMYLCELSTSVNTKLVKFIEIIKKTGIYDKLKDYIPYYIVTGSSVLNHFLIQNGLKEKDTSNDIDIFVKYYDNKIFEIFDTNNHFVQIDADIPGYPKIINITKPFGIVIQTTSKFVFEDICINIIGWNALDDQTGSISKYYVTNVFDFINSCLFLDDNLTSIHIISEGVKKPEYYTKLRFGKLVLSSDYDFIIKNTILRGRLEKYIIGHGLEPSQNLIDDLKKILEYIERKKDKYENIDDNNSISFIRKLVKFYKI